MEMKNKALALADQLYEKRDVFTGSLLEDSSAMIRRLVEELDRLDYDLKALVKLYKELNKTKPLSDEEIMKLLNGIEYNPAEVETSFDYEIRIARAIEERHGIK